MLQHLHISNYALIEELDIDFFNGFSVITGETGAGKSIILGAVGLLTGQRADAKAIKAGARKCVVEATFSLEGQDFNAFFEDNDIDADTTALVRREVTDSGKSRAFINDTPVTAGTLKAFCGQLLDIHSQHQNLLLGREDFLIDTLDSLSPKAEPLEHYRKAYAAWRTAALELQRLTEQTAQHADGEYLHFQLEQLEAAALTDGEQEELEAEVLMLRHAEDIKRALYSAFPNDTDPAALLRRSAQELEHVCNVFQPAVTLAERLDSVRIEVDDIREEVERLATDVDYDPKRLEYVEARLNTIYELERKHHAGSIGELLQKAAQIKEELYAADHAEELLTQAKAECAARLQAAQECGRALSAVRQKAAREAEKTLQAQLGVLGMPAGRISFDFSPKPHPEAKGSDNVRLLFSANSNTPLQDASRVASGGEISRLMLALKALLSQTLKLPTLIFDEIDTGVSGTMAERMAQVMQDIAQKSQVLCITHLPQIAAKGSCHYRVRKQDNGQDASTHIERLTTDQRVAEIANMLSGEEMTEAAINNAKSLLKL